ncbi:rhomboid family intramembrane serine protease [Lacimicrobium alkaliphilum]|uniref:Rhomboid family intramembrane serine protease n=1 Tax=Lacimicrobium alkaliphilum TaxID=1526571 RepID=A0A0U3BCG6_9ALTE|nr:rhomboid family intramembrane serine protease [Lacimicrobium alkaliphilum]ALS99365.1 rhomboid family intramembrane serine protease [Lacimicrobium alkaliphilum]
MLKNQFKITLWLLGLFVVVEIINLLSGRSLNQFGLLPREVQSLPGVLTAPFLHGNLGHFLSNIIPLAIFSLLMLEYGARRALLVNLWIILMSGILVWILGRYALHIGASGLIYGQFGFLLLAGFYHRHIIKILISLGVGVVYGSMIFGVLPGRAFISWEFHLFGFIAGLLAAHYFNGRKRDKTH